MPRDKKLAASKSRSMRWEFDPHIPTHDFFENGSPEKIENLAEAVESFVFWMEKDRFLTWEAIVCEEQGIPLTPKQKRLLNNLWSFSDEEDDEILYINEIPRPSEPWHVILNKIAPHLLIEPFRTFDMHYEEQCDGWDQIVAALREHGEGLSLPAGAESAEEVVPAELRHKLWLQSCFDELSGLGQEESITLGNAGQQDRIENLIDRLRECKASVAYFGLTLDSLLTRVILPERDRPIFLELMQEKLGLASAQEPIANRL